MPVTPTHLPQAMWSELPQWAVTPDEPVVLLSSECNNPLAVVSRENLLPVDECQQDLVFLQEHGIPAFDGVQVSRMVVDDIAALADAAEEAGYPVLVSQGWRDCASQELVFTNFVERFQGDQNLAHQYTFRCGSSTHHLGTAVDLLFAENGYEEGFGHPQSETQTYAWLLENIADYGCVLEYPKGKQEVTGLLWEPWHYRCGIPVEAAREIMNSEITLAEWLESN